MIIFADNTEIINDLRAHTLLHQSFEEKFKQLVQLEKSQSPEYSKKLDEFKEDYTKNQPVYSILLQKKKTQAIHLSKDQQSPVLGHIQEVINKRPEPPTFSPRSISGQG